MKIVYIAGKYQAPHLNGVRINVLRAEALAMAYWAKGYGVICPHKNCNLIECPGLTEEQIMEAFFTIIRRCVDVMVMIPGWQDSRGATQEHDLAKALGIEIIYETEEIISEYLKKQVRGTNE